MGFRRWIYQKEKREKIRSENNRSHKTNFQRFSIVSQSDTEDNRCKTAVDNYKFPYGLAYSDVNNIANAVQQECKEKLLENPNLDQDSIKDMVTNLMENKLHAQGITLESSTSTSTTVSFSNNDQNITAQNGSISYNGSVDNNTINGTITIGGEENNQSKRWTPKTRPFFLISCGV